MCAYCPLVDLVPTGVHSVFLNRNKLIKVKLMSTVAAIFASQSIFITEKQQPFRKSV
jgi:hypothetical protein